VNTGTLYTYTVDCLPLILNHWYFQAYVSGWGARSGEGCSTTGTGPDGHVKCKFPFLAPPPMTMLTASNEEKNMKAVNHSECAFSPTPALTNAKCAAFNKGNMSNEF